jgi:hypothetical protein
MLAADVVPDTSKAACLPLDECPVLATYIIWLKD